MKVVHAAECREQAWPHLTAAVEATTTAKALIELSKARCLLAQAAAIEAADGDPA